MNTLRAPKKQGLHRQAVFALYRELLLSCLSVPLPSETQHRLQDIVRNRFHAHKQERNRQRIKLAFHAGYTALDLLDEAGLGERASLDRVKDYLARIPKNVASAPKKRPVNKTEKRGPETYKPPAEHKFLTTFPRPLRLPKPEDLTAEELVTPKPRKVPFFVSAQGLPFVRFKKPQPANVSRVLRQKREGMDRQLWYVQHMLDYHIPLAQYEDRWEDALRQKVEDAGQQSPEFLPSSETSYQEPLLSVGSVMARENENRLQNRIALARQMSEIVDKEAEYAAVEKTAWKELKRQRWELRQGQALTSHDTASPTGGKHGKVTWTPPST